MDIFNLEGKTALITGASAGLGEEFARILSKAGARVILAARRSDKLEQLALECQNARALPMDVSDRNSVRNAFKKLEDLEERIDICINNAGVARLTSVFDDDPNNDFETIVQTNLMGTWYVIKEMAKHMKKHQIQGSIINIGSINGDGVPSVAGHAYNASKAAVMHLTKALVGELSHHHIRVNAIVPGLFITDMSKRVRDQLGSALPMLVPVGFAADPNDMAGLILYLASNKASRYVTGACFTIDGGCSWGGLKH